MKRREIIEGTEGAEHSQGCARGTGAGLSRRDYRGREEITGSALQVEPA